MKSVAKMSWEHVYNLLRGVGGKIELADPRELEAATAKGPGDPETQIRIARLTYQHDIEKQKGKEENNGQNEWHFA